MPFSEIISGLKNFNANAWGLVADSIQANEQEILKINTDRLYDKGLDSEEEKLKNQYASYSVYSKPYTKVKKKAGRYNGHVNLKLSGKYLKAFELKTTDTVVDIDVNEGQADLDAILADMYGQNIQGLTEKEWQEVVEDYIMPYLMVEFNKIFA